MSRPSDEIQRAALTAFESMVDLSDAQQVEQLNQLRDTDPDLHAEVIRLQAAQQPAQAAFQTGHASLMALTERPPERVGPYKLGELIGRGGMGVVYRAERDDGAFNRTVAIKFVEAAMNNSEATARFANERAILAQMSHPNIATLLDGGEYQNRPYLVMEHVDGEPFEFNAARPLAQTLDTFAGVCSAVSYAHNKLVLHRDLKPNNILVTAAGKPTLLDFGIAKLTDTLAEERSPDLTQKQKAPMTLNYSAPELLAGEPATVASEIYALGICLYELTNGERPYDVAGLSAVKAHSVVTGQLLNSHSGHDDLDRIIETAAHQDPEQRYGTVAALQQDLQRFQQGAPVLARGDDWRYLVRRVMHRYRTLLMVGTAGLMALMAGLALALWGFVRAEEQAQIASAEAQTSATTVAFISELLSSANPWEGTPVNSTVAELLQMASDGLQDTYADQPRVHGYILATLTDVYIGRGEFDAALASATEAHALLQRHPDQLEPYAAVILRAYGSALQEVGNSAEAMTVLTEAVQRFEAEPNTDWSALAVTLSRLGTILIEQNQEDEAEQRLLQSLAIHNGPHLHDPEAKSSVLNNLSSLYNTQANLPEAARYLNLSRQEMEKYDANPALLGINHGNLAGLFTKLKRFDEAERHYLEAVRLQTKVISREHPEALVNVTSLGYMYIVSGQLDKAVATMEPALQALTPLAADHPIRAYVENVAGLAYCESGDADTGLPLTERSLTAREVLFPDGHWLIHSSNSVVARCATVAGDFARAEQLLRPAAAALLELRGPEDEVAQLAQRRLQWLQEAMRAAQAAVTES